MAAAPGADQLPPRRTSWRNISLLVCPPQELPLQPWVWCLNNVGRARMGRGEGRCPYRPAMKRHSARGASLVEGRHRPAAGFRGHPWAWRGCNGRQAHGLPGGQRSAAAGMAVDLLERMRANLVFCRTIGFPDWVRPLEGRLPAHWHPVSPSNVRRRSVRFDLWEWERILNGELTFNGGGLVRLACVASRRPACGGSNQLGRHPGAGCGPSADQCGGARWAVLRGGTRGTAYDHLDREQLTVPGV